MAQLQGSGAISLANLQSVMGGSNPISLSEYYRGGAYTPTTVSVTNRDPASGFYYSLWSYVWYDSSESGNYYDLYFGGRLGVTFSQNVTTYTVGGYTYYRGSLMGANYYSGGYASSGFTLRYYGIARTWVTSTTVNTGVPSSGTIRLSNFFGAQK